MNRKATVLLAWLVLGSAVVLSSLETKATTFFNRQYYSSWAYVPQHQYYTRYYYYLPQPQAQQFHFHVVYYYPQTYPNYYYYYNPNTNYYWGRTPVKSDKPVYSMLAEKDRRKDLKDIPESAFPEPSSPPPIPESTDKVAMEMPPKDAPSLPKK